MSGIRHALINNQHAEDRVLVADRCLVLRKAHARVIVTRITEALLINDRYSGRRGEESLFFVEAIRRALPQVDRSIAQHAKAQVNQYFPQQTLHEDGAAVFWNRNNRLQSIDPLHRLA